MTFIDQTITIVDKVNGSLAEESRSSALILFFC